MKTVLILSDIHVGSKLAVAPPTFRTMDGATYEGNRVQKALFRMWQQAVDKWPKPDYLIVNGEPLDGQGVKNQGTEQWTTTYEDQIAAAVQLVKMFKAKNVYCTRGSNYHVQIGGTSIEEVFGEKVGAKAIDGAHVVPHFFLKAEDVTFHFAHHLSSSTSTWQYRTTPIARELVVMLLNETKMYHADVVVRSHNHFYCYAGFRNQLGICTPCWQLQTWNSQRQTIGGTVTHIGAIRFTVENGGYDWEEHIGSQPEFKPPLVNGA